MFKNCSFEGFESDMAERDLARLVSDDVRVADWHVRLHALKEQACECGLRFAAVSQENRKDVVAPKEWLFNRLGSAMVRAYVFDAYPGIGAAELLRSVASSVKDGYAGRLAEVTIRALARTGLGLVVNSHELYKVACETWEEELSSRIRRALETLVSDESGATLNSKTASRVVRRAFNRIGNGESWVSLAVPRCRNALLVLDHYPAAYSIGQLRRFVVDVDFRRRVIQTVTATALPDLQLRATDGDRSADRASRALLEALEFETMVDELGIRQASEALSPEDSYLASILLPSEETRAQELRRTALVAATSPSDAFRIARALLEARTITEAARKLKTPTHIQQTP